MISRSKAWIQARRRWLWAALVVISLVAAVSLPWSLAGIVRASLQLAGAKVSLESLRGHWLTTLELRGLSISWGALEVAADTVILRPDHRGLIAGRWHLSEVALVGADLRLKPPAGTPPEPDNADPPKVRVDYFTVREGRLTLPDSVAVASSIWLEGRLGPGWDLRLDTLYTSLQWDPNVQPVSLASRAQWDGGRLDLDTLIVTGQQTVMVAGGHVEPGIGADVRLRTTPLHLQELAPWMPHSEESLILEARLVGPDSAMHLSASGTFTDGGYVVAAATLNPLRNQWVIDSLRIRNLNPAVVSDLAPGRIAADIEGYLLGRSAGHLSGELVLTDVRGSLSGVSMDAVQASAAITNGQAALDVQGQLASAYMDLKGEVALAEMHGRIGGAFRGFDIGRYVAHQSSAIDGSVQVDLAEELTAGLTLIGGRMGARSITAGKIRGRMDSVSFEIAGLIATDQGAIILDSRRRDSVLTGQLRLTDLDLAGLTGADAFSRVNAEVDLNGRWPPDSLTMDLRADSSWLNELAVGSALARIEMDRSDVQADFEINTAAGDARGVGGLNYSGPHPVWSVSRMSITGADMKAFGAPVASHLTGALRLSGRGLDQVEASARLENSWVGEQAVDSAHLALGVVADTGAVSVQIYWPGGGLDLAADMDSLLDAPAVSLRHANFEGVNLGAILSDTTWRTQLTGVIDRAFIRSGSGHLQMHLDSSTVNRQVVRGGTIELLAAEGATAGRLSLELPSGYLVVDTLLQRADGSFATRGRVRELDLEALAGLEAVASGSFDLAGSGSDLESLVLERAEVFVSDAAVSGIVLEAGRARGAWRDGYLRLDTLALDSGVARLQASGALALKHGIGQELELVGHLRDVGPLRRWLGPATGGGSSADSFRVHITSGADSLLYSVGFGLGPATWRDLRIFNTQGRLRGYVIGLRPTLSEAELEVSRVSVPALAARSASLAVRHQEGALQYDAQLIVDDRRRASVRGYADLAQQRLVLEDLDMRLDEDHWHLDQAATISTGDRYRVRNLLIVEDAQEVAIDGVLDFNGQQNLGISLFEVQVGRFADLLGLEDLGGTVNGGFFLSGPAASPVVSGSIVMDVHQQDRSIGDLRAEVEYGDFRLGVDAALTHHDGSSLRLFGYVPVDLRLARAAPMPDVDTALRIKSDALNLAWITPFLDPDVVRDLSGNLTADLDLAGTAESPRLTGTAYLADLSMHLPELGITLAQGQLRTRAVGDTIRVRDLSAHSGQGTLAGQGQVILESLRSLQLDLALALDDFTLVNTRPYQADADGRLRLAGTLVRPVLDGRLDMTGAVIRPQEAAADMSTGRVAFTEEDLRMLEQFFNIRVTAQDTTTYSVADALSMDLEVGIPGNVWLRSVRNPEMDVALAGSLRMIKAAFEQQQIIGTLSVVPSLSSVHQFGRRFDIRRGRVTFAGPSLDPYFDLQAAMAVREQSTQDAQVTILLEARGRLQETNSIELNLRSEPINLDPADILHYIATGRPAADAFQSAGTSTLEAGSGLAIGQLNSLIAGAAGAGLGLDVVRIQPEGSRGLTVTAGKHISRRLFTSVSWPLASETLSDASRLQSRKALSVEYVLYPWLLARLRADTSALGLSVLTQYTW
ncbi:MAG: translocation/assembly module TamB domain-containing protein [Bacteroidota bacterium]|nr:translocation/assembly module TamB domain-containing protein [Bacteroidota bacterium]